MAGKSTATSKCRNCGNDATPTGEWEAVEHPTLGSVTRCPECGSTDVSSLR